MTSKEKIYYDVYSRRIDNYYFSNLGYCTGNIVVREDDLEIITEHYANGTVYDEELVYLDFSYTLHDLECGGKDFINNLRVEYFFESKFSPSCWFNLDCITVPKSFYKSLLKGELENEK